MLEVRYSFYNWGTTTFNAVVTCQVINGLYLIDFEVQFEQRRQLFQVLNFLNEIVAEVEDLE